MAPNILTFAALLGCGSETAAPPGAAEASINPAGDVASDIASPKPDADAGVCCQGEQRDGGASPLVERQRGWVRVWSAL